MDLALERLEASSAAAAAEGGAQGEGGRPPVQTVLGIFDLRGFTSANADWGFVRFLVDIFFLYYPKVGCIPASSALPCSCVSHIALALAVVWAARCAARLGACVRLPALPFLVHTCATPRCKGGSLLGRQLAVTACCDGAA